MILVVSYLLLTVIPTYCCTHRVDVGIGSDVGNILPLCEGEVDFISQVPNLINYQLLQIVSTINYNPFINN